MNNLLVGLAITISFGATANAQKNDQYTITGIIRGIPDGTQFFLVRNNEKHGVDTVARTSSLGDKFMFSGALNKNGQYFFVKMDTTSLKLNGKKRSSVCLLMDNTSITLSGQVQQWPEISISGSKETEDHEHYFKLMEEKIVLIRELLQKTDSIGESNFKSEGLFKEFLADFVISHRDSYVSAYSIFRNLGLFSYQEISQLYSALSNRVKASYYGLKLRERILLLKEKQKLELAKIPDFAIRTVDGKTETIMNIIKQSNYTLIDFWASWCVPCKKDIPKLRNAYQIYQDKGFNILSISTDLDSAKWKKAVSEDKVNWPHVLDASDASGVIFGIKTLPAYILVNREGEILGVDCSVSSIPNVQNIKYSDLRGDDLIVVLTEIMPARH